MISRNTRNDKVSRNKKHNFCDWDGPKQEPLFSITIGRNVAKVKQVADLQTYREKGIGSNSLFKVLILDGSMCASRRISVINKIAKDAEAAVLVLSIILSTVMMTAGACGLTLTL